MMDLLETLHAEQVENNVFEVSLTNGETIRILKDTPYNDQVWAWKVSDQYFSYDLHAEKYLKRLIAEKLSGIRIIYRKRGAVPEICGVDGCACRAPGQCNRALCYGCPVAEAFFAARDGVRIVYAV